MALEMFVARCGGCGTGTSLTAQRTTASRSADGRRSSTVAFSPRLHPCRGAASCQVRCSSVDPPDVTPRSGDGRRSSTVAFFLPNRVAASGQVRCSSVDSPDVASRSADGRRSSMVAFSPLFHPHRGAASGPVRCSSVDSPDVVELSAGEGKKDEEWESLKAEVANMSRPLLSNLAEICSLRRAYDLEDYQIGMLSGAFLGCVGCYQLWKTVPSVFVDVALSFLLYKLSIVSSELHRQHKSNSLTTRLKFGTILFMVLKDLKKNYVLLDVVRMPLFLLYICSFLFDLAGLKKYGRRGLMAFVNLVKMKGGFQEICRIMWLPGYVSPYDDGVDWSNVRP